MGSGTNYTEIYKFDLETLTAVARYETSTYSIGFVVTPSQLLVQRGVSVGLGVPYLVVEDEEGTKISTNYAVIDKIDKDTMLYSSSWESQHLTNHLGLPDEFTVYSFKHHNEVTGTNLQSIDSTNYYTALQISTYTYNILSETYSVSETYATYSYMSIDLLSAAFTHIKTFTVSSEIVDYGFLQVIGNYIFGAYITNYVILRKSDFSVFYLSDGIPYNNGDEESEADVHESYVMPCVMTEHEVLYAQ
jgi:hypothetical protein